MNNKKTRWHLTIAEDASGILDDVQREGKGGSTSASSYVELLVREADQRWRQAMHSLVDGSTWTAAEMLQVCRMFASLPPLNLDTPPSWIGAQILVGMPAEQVTERIRALCWGVSRDERDGPAMRTVLLEYQRGNPRVAKTLEALATAPATNDPRASAAGGAR